MFAKFEMANTSRLPMWKAQGYPEYVAMSATRLRPGYSPNASVTRILHADLAWLRDARGEFSAMRYDCIGKSYLEDENGDFWHTCYYLSRVLVEYLLDEKNLSFAELAKSSVGESETLHELLRAYHAGELISPRP
ncbi:MAG TPA: hypothetical protein VGO61_18280 [Steroidobacteraceae bacterium]|nr:hypothetical protein [Steroidobacteraceae bacterium]